MRKNESKSVCLSVRDGRNQPQKGPVSRERETSHGQHANKKRRENERDLQPPEEHAAEEGAVHRPKGCHHPTASTGQVHPPDIPLLQHASKDGSVHGDPNPWMSWTPVAWRSGTTYRQTPVLMQCVEKGGVSPFHVAKILEIPHKNCTIFVPQTGVR